MKKILLGSIVLLASCSQIDEDYVTHFSSNELEICIQDKDQMFSKFAGALSTVIYEHQEARQVLKEEVLKQFDKNYEVLWLDLQDKKVGNSTFRELIEKESSTAFVDGIDAQYPLLNVLFPEIPMVNISPEMYDASDNDLPVIVPGKNMNKLYFKGVVEDSLEIGEVPDFNVVVINENSRVVVGPQTRGGKRSYSFKSPNYDGTKPAVISRASIDCEGLTTKERNAYNYFHSTGNDNDQMAYQRDYLYYGMTPTSEKGVFNSNTSEYISHIRINKNAYFTITDKVGGSSFIDASDPYIQATTAEQYKRGLSNEELIDRMWTKGAYNFRFEIYNSNNTNPTICYIPLKPSEIWDFNIELYDYRHSTWFRHSRYRYRIDPNKFTSKLISFDSNLIDLGKWDLSREALSRYVMIYEDDPQEIKTETFTWEFITTTSNKVNGNVKMGLGITEKINLDASIGGDVNNSTTKKETRTFTVNRSTESDKLGSLTVNFYDPLIEKVSGNKVVRKTYNTGTVEFCISVK